MSTTTTTPPTETPRPPFSTVASTATELRRRYQHWFESWTGLARKLTATGLHPEVVSALRRASFLSFLSAASSYAPPFLRRPTFFTWNATNNTSNNNEVDDGTNNDDNDNEETRGGLGMLANMGGRSFNDLGEVGGVCRVRGNGIGHEGVSVVYDTSFRRCGVCLMEYNEGEILRVLPCSHALHEKCAKGWLKVDSVCPYCKMEVGGVEVCGGGEGRRGRMEGGVQLIDYSVTISWSEWIRGFMWDGNASTD